MLNLARFFIMFFILIHVLLYVSISGTVYVIDCELPYDVIKIPGITVISPNYPLAYGDDLICQVTLTFEDRVVIKFEDFDLYDYSDCPFDWLEVRDGDDSNSEMIGDKLCGHDIPDPIESTGSSITLIFRSDEFYYTSDTGFKTIADLGRHYSYVLFSPKSGRLTISSHINLILTMFFFHFQLDVLKLLYYKLMNHPKSFILAFFQQIENFNNS